MVVAWPLVGAPPPFDMPSGHCVTSHCAALLSAIVAIPEMDQQALPGGHDLKGFVLVDPPFGPHHALQ